MDKGRLSIGLAALIIVAGCGKHIQREPVADRLPTTLPPQQPTESLDPEPYPERLHQAAELLSHGHAEPAGNIFAAILAELGAAAIDLSTAEPGSEPPLELLPPDQQTFAVQSLCGLGVVQEISGHSQAAAAAYRRARLLQPGHLAVANNLAWLLATVRDATLRDPGEAWELSQEVLAALPDESSREGARAPFPWSTPPRHVVADTAAAAAAALGQRQPAIEFSRQALQGAEQTGDASTIAQAEKRLEQYTAGRCFRAGQDTLTSAIERPAADFAVWLTKIPLANWTQRELRDGLLAAAMLIGTSDDPRWSDPPAISAVLSRLRLTDAGDERWQTLAKQYPENRSVTPRRYESIDGWRKEPAPKRQGEAWADALTVVAQQRAAEGNLDAAQWWAEGAAALAPRRRHVRQALAQILAAEQDWQESARQWLLVLELGHDDPDVLFPLSIALSAQGLEAQAAAYLVWARRIDPEHIDCTLQLAWLLATSADARLREPNLAVELAASVLPDCVLPEPETELSASQRRRAVQALDVMAAALAASGKFERASRTQAAALKWSDSLEQEAAGVDSYGLNLRAQLYAAGRPFYNLARAEAELGTLALRGGEVATARRLLMQAARVLQNDRSILNCLGIAAEMEGRFDEAAHFYASAIQVDPHWPDPLNNLAWLALNHPQVPVMGRSPLSLAAEACELTEHREPSFLDTLALAQAKLGQFDQAAATAQHALAMVKDPVMKDAIVQRLEEYERQEPVVLGP